MNMSTNDYVTLSQAYILTNDEVSNCVLNDFLESSYLPWPNSLFKYSIAEQKESFRDSLEIFLKNEVEGILVNPFTDLDLDEISKKIAVNYALSTVLTMPDVENCNELAFSKEDYQKYVEKAEKVDNPLEAHKLAEQFIDSLLIKNQDNTYSKISAVNSQTDKEEQEQYRGR